ncbi:DUF2498 family protein [Vibrio zhugei]|uniref:DUF2498 family protein n=1 Tax=Vibrio zhugei TaxID=2479546 RepID=A0ABV7C6B2_9VIBR|nr:DUF2498 family protein [Vibrio zhugei]
MSQKIAIPKSDLLMIANQALHDHDQYVEGIYATDVEEKNDVLIFKGDCFLDHQGLPTTKTNTVFNLFKFLAHELSTKFTIQEK